MSLMHLLAVGHSFLGMKTQPHRYKLCEQKFLPKFAPVGRPVSLMPAPMQEKSPLGAEPLFNKKASASPPTDPAIPPPPPPKRGGARAIAVPELHPQAAEAVRAAGKTAWKIFGARPSAGAARPLVQSELSLDRVKVMRNDLYDTDLEIVPMQPVRQAVQDAPSASHTDIKPAAGRVWAQLAARLFAANRPQP